MTTAGTQSQYAHVNIRRLRHRKTSVMAKKGAGTNIPHNNRMPYAVLTPYYIYVSACQTGVVRQTRDTLQFLNQLHSFIHSLHVEGDEGVMPFGQSLV